MPPKKSCNGISAHTPLNIPGNGSNRFVRWNWFLKVHELFMPNVFQRIVDVIFQSSIKVRCLELSGRIEAGKVLQEWMKTSFIDADGRLH
jgi:hypothetical protein